PAAAPGPLLRRSLGNVLHPQLLDFAAVAVALHARQARVHYVADSRHGERGLGDVGREHNAPANVRFEYALLLLGREPGKQGQDLRVTRVALAQRLRGFPDLALSGQEHEHVALTLACELLRRIADRVIEIVVVVLR